MASSGSTTVTACIGYDGSIQDELKFSWEKASSDVSTMTSVVNWKLQLIAKGSGQISTSVLRPCEVWVTGVCCFSQNTSVAISNNGTKTLASGSMTIYHSASTGEAAFSYAFSQTFDITFNTYVGTVNGSGSGTLDKLDCAATITKITADNSSFTFDKRIYVSFDENSRYSYKLWYRIVDPDNLRNNWYTGNTPIWYDLSNLSSYKTSTGCISFIAGTPDSKYCVNKKYVTVELSLATYSGSTKIGEEDCKSLNVYVPENSATAPSIVGAVKTIDNSAIPESVRSTFSGMCLSGVSKVTVDATVSTKYEASIGSAKWSMDGQTAALGSHILPLTGGTKNISINVSDTRGFAVSDNSLSVNVTSYAAPQILPYAGGKVICERSDKHGNSSPDGTCLKIRAKVSYTDLDESNSCTVKLRWRKSGTTSFSQTVISETGGLVSLVVNNASTPFYDGNSANTKTGYDIEIVASDTVGKSATMAFKLPSSTVLLHMGLGGTSLGIGRYAYYNASNPPPTESDPEKRVDIAGGFKLYHGDGLVDIPVKTVVQDRFIYRLWQSGFLELFYTSEEMSVTLSSSGQFHTNSITDGIVFPAGSGVPAFTQIIGVFCSAINTSGSGCLVWADGVTNTKISKIRLAGLDVTNTVRICAHVIGKGE